MIALIIWWDLVWRGLEFIDAYLIFAIAFVPFPDRKFIPSDLHPRSSRLINVSPIFTLLLAVLGLYIFWAKCVSINILHVHRPVVNAGHVVLL